MRINEVAKLTGITVRTLHYYDQIGLLTPHKVVETGYRIYGEEELARLQQILFFRELGFSLDTIKEIMNSPGYDKQKALIKQKDLLLKKRERLDAIIQLVDQVMRGESVMEFNAFDEEEIRKMKEDYSQEVQERWGTTKAYEQSNQKSKEYTKDQWQEVMMNAQALFRAFADNKEKAPDCKEVQQLVRQWKNYITSNFYDCTEEILAGLGKMYVADERFKNNLDQYGEGTAKFMSEAIDIYCKN